MSMKKTFALVAVSVVALLLACVQPQPSIECDVPPTGSFGTVWAQDPDLQAELDCPVSLHPRVTPVPLEVQTSYQPFEHGEMVWSEHHYWYDQPVIFVHYEDSTFQRLDDTFDPAVDPVSGGETPPAGLLEPVHGFGKVWREQPGVRESLGWATAPETPGVGQYQKFVGGDMVWTSQTDQTYVYVFDGQVLHVFDVTFSEY
jgi:hypothetical protein